MARVKKKEHEKLSSANIQHVISLLEPQDSSKPISKKDACQILNISYNTTRLQKIIDEYKERQDFVERRKAENRGKRATRQEIAEIIRSHLQAEPLSSIATSLFRSSGFVKGVIERIGVPQRATGEDKGKTALLPEACIATEFDVGETVWAAKYHAPAKIVKELFDPKYEERYGSRCYQISVIEQVDSSDSFFPFIEAGGFNAFALAYDLGSLKHLEEYEVDLTKV